MTPTRKHLLKILYPLLGLGTLLWFLIRVIPKPSRASYPCMRVAAPLASAFVLWLLGMCASWLFIRQVGRFFRRSRYAVAAATLVAGGIVGATLLSSPHSSLFASTRAASAVPNSPFGTAKGVNPGRVVWAHDTNAARWRGPGFGHIWESANTNQTAVDGMVSRSLTALSGMPTALKSWDTLFRYYNGAHGRGRIGYQVGEKIVIKVNFTSTNHLAGWCAADTTTYSLANKIDFVNTTPQLIRALLRQLVYVVGVSQADIAVGDPVCYYPNEYYDSCHAEFPDVQYLDYGGKNGRTKVAFSTVPMYWSSRPSGVRQDYIEQHIAEATYMINCAVMKSHAGNGITLCAKNHYGSFIRLPADSGYYDLHQSLPFMMPAMGNYRTLVDIMGHADLGGKTMLYMVDGIYSQNHNTDTMPRKWRTAPFNNGWTASIFSSQDPVALESMLFDLFQLDDDPAQYPKMAGVEDYLLEAARADNPPSGTFYDPNHATATTRLPSLGVYEHWNNDVDRKYSRNLGTGNGIELVTIEGESSGVRGVKKSNQSPSVTMRPTGRNGEFTLAVPDACEMRFELFDARGRMAGRVTERYGASGSYGVDVKSTFGKTRALAAGTYVVAVIDQADKNHKPVAVLKTSIAGR
jgi:uncharacterized protein (DUF362 family)